MFKGIAEELNADFNSGIFFSKTAQVETGFGRAFRTVRTAGEAVRTEAGKVVEGGALRGPYAHCRRQWVCKQIAMPRRKGRGKIPLHFLMSLHFLGAHFTMRRFAPASQSSPTFPTEYPKGAFGSARIFAGQSNNRAIV